MNFDTVVFKLNEIVTAKTKQELSRREKEILDGDWKNLTYEQMAVEKNLTVNYLKGHLAPLLWHRLSIALEEEVNKRNWKEVVLRKLSKQSQKSVLLDTTFLIGSQENNQSNANNLDFTSPLDISYFSSNNNQFKEIKKALQDKSSRVILLSGMKGMGKTVMAARLYQDMEQDNSGRFRDMYWLPFNKPFSLSTLLNFLLRKLKYTEFSGQQNIDDQISFIISLLSECPCLLVLDQVDALLEEKSIAGKYQQKYEDYQQFFKRVAEEYHQSCLLITSRQNLVEIDSLAGSQSPVRSFWLEGLSPEELQEMMKQRMIRYNSEQINTLIDYYKGNPLCLRLAVAFIAEVCDRSVAEFLRLETFICGGIADLVKDHYTTLSEKEQNILKFLCQQNELVTLQGIINHDNSISKFEILDLIQSLKRRHILETLTKLDPDTQEERTFYGLKRMIKEYVQEEVIKKEKELVAGSK